MNIQKIICATDIVNIIDSVIKRYPLTAYIVILYAENLFLLLLKRLEDSSGEIPI
jgi:hypothetical protein